MSTTLSREGDVFVLNLGDTENRFNLESVAVLGALLDEVSAAHGPKALVTVGTGKFWSNGLDLDWLLASSRQLEDLVVPVQELFARILEADYPTVAAIQGHCYAAGAMLALAHDARLMREDRGFLCFPEVDIKMTFTAGMQSLLASKLTAPTAHQAMVGSNSQSQRSPSSSTYSSAPRKPAISSSPMASKLRRSDQSGRSMSSQLHTAVATTRPTGTLIRNNQCQE